MKDKYDSLYFWEQMLDKSDGVLSIFKDKPIVPESVFFHGVIVNCNSTNLIDEWFCFPEVKALLGFIKYIYLPTAYFMFLGNEEELNFVYADGNTLLEHMESHKDCNNKHMIPDMRDFIEKIDGIFNSEDDSILNELKHFSDTFQKSFNKGVDRFAYFNIFQNPSEVGKFLLNSYKDDENMDINDIESQLGVSAEEWLNICENVYENAFMRKRFIEILNNRIEDML